MPIAAFPTLQAGPSLKMSAGHFLYVPSLFRYCPLSGLWTSAACGTSSDLIASVCSFCSSVQTLQSGLLQSQLHSWRRLCSCEQSATCLASGHSLPRWISGTPALTGLSPIGRLRLADGDAFGTLNFMSYIHHSRRTQWLAAIVA